VTIPVRPDIGRDREEGRRGESDEPTFGLLLSDECGREDVRHRDPQVDPVPERAGHSVGVALDDTLRAAALPAVRARVATRARVHRRDELEPRGERRGPPDPRDRHPPLLERLSERLEHVPPELGELVEEQDAVVGLGASIVPRRPILLRDQ
jgi:hypothetical protein